MDKMKRERSANFCSDERDLLVSLVQKYRETLENKLSDGATWKKKEMAWEQIEKEFNAHSGGTFRSSKTLRIKYEGLKRTVRKKSAAIRSELYRTGGGPNSAIPLDSTEVQIKSMISLSTDGLESVYDSDVLPPVQNEGSTDVQIKSMISMSTDGLESVYGSDVLPPVQNEDQSLKLSVEEYTVLPPTSEDFELVTETDDEPLPKTAPSHKKWDVTSRRNLKTRRHPTLIANTPNSSKKSFEKLAEAKLELIELQKQLLEAEIIEKKKEWEFNEKERQWKDEEYKLKLDKLRKELKE